MLNSGYILDGKYEVLKILGQGGMSIVYLCRNNRLGNLWAVKEVSKDLNINIDLLAEPNILKKLSHPGIPRIIDIFEENNSLYIVEDYIEGMTLKDYISENKSLNNETIIDITSQLCSILKYLHSFNPPIIFRDLKPSNIIVKPNKSIMLIDFGIARIFKENQTGDTVILGSQGYIAPEQLMKVQSNIQTDVYSLGAVMYFIATGKTLSSKEDLEKVKNYPDTLDSNIVSVIKKACAFKPEDRFKDVSELFDKLNNEIMYEKTTIMEHDDTTKEFSKTTLIPANKKNKKPILPLLLGLFAVLLLVFFVSKSVLKNNKTEAVIPTQSQKASETNSQLTAGEKIDSQPLIEEKPEEKDVSITGIIYRNNPTIINSDSNESKGKGKGKEKKGNNASNYSLLYKLDPSALLSNSGVEISLNNIEIINNNIIIYISIQNKSNTEMKLDLNNTYLIDGEGHSEKCYSQIPTLTIPANTKYNEVKVYFENAELKGSSFLLRTYINKVTNLYVDIK